MTDKLQELKQSIYYDKKEIDQLDDKIAKINDQNLQEQAGFFKNHYILNICKITKEFIRLESRKNGYCNILKLGIPKEDKNWEPDIITELKKIRGEIAGHFQEIFKLQDVNKDRDRIKDFLLSDNDTQPY